MTQQTTDLRTRALRALFDLADPAATIAAAAAAGLTAYRALAAHPAETRTTLALAAAGLAAALTDQHTHHLLTPLRARLGIERHPAPTTAAPSLAQLAQDATANTAARAASGAIHLDFSSGCLTNPRNWQGQSDGTATCELTPAAHLLYQPSGTDSGLAEYSGRPRYYELVADGEHPIVVTTVTQLADLLQRHADRRPLDGSDEDDPWAAVSQDTTTPGTVTDDDTETDEDQADDHRDQETEARADARP
ncbi:hypothetical protein ACIQWA_36540 [Kitasatospora sp. NPDC098652]|uniref:hypothetical protein n=1 Tax=Kitasatospora sp. NPDC098652 TaxID=3364095 RepID=UPI0038086CA7